jgi:hypothetical protein
MTRRADAESLLKPQFADNLVAMNLSYKPANRISKPLGISAAELET